MKKVKITGSRDSLPGKMDQETLKNRTFKGEKAGIETIRNPAGVRQIKTQTDTKPRRRILLRSKTPDRLRINVTHGNIAFSPAAVAVGHYQDDIFVSAEAYLDRVLGGKLRDRYRLGVYPGAYDTCEVFLNPGKRPGGAIIIGLGTVGSLTAGKLEDAFARAALKYAVALAETRTGKEKSEKKEEAPACISSVLMGSGGHGLPVAQSVRAIIRGVLKANDALQTGGLNNHIIFKTLELIEIYEDRALQAIRAVHDLEEDANLRNRILPAGTLRILDGGLFRASYEENPGWWHRIQITETDQGEIKYVILTHRARAEGQLQRTQRPVIDALLDKAAEAGSDPQGLGNTLFELLIPNELKDAAQEMTSMMFIVDRATARYPWELMRDRTAMQNEPLVVRAKFIRQYSTERYRRQVKMTGKSTALVIGDPLSTKYPSLPGAQKEAGKVARRLRDAGFETPCLVRSDYRAILGELFAREYRILHLAAHGVYEYEGEDGCDKDDNVSRQMITGMVLGDDMFLTPAEINQMRVVPELVFINCCLLGKVGQAELQGSRSALAANLATQLIEMGVRAVVAAGWEVDDNAALRFADVFYEQMLSGETFGEALLAARKETFKFPDSNTWGAYQAYGDPDYTLFDGNAAFPKAQPIEPYFAPTQPILALKNIAAQARNADKEGLEKLKPGLHSVMKGLPDSWLDLAEIRTSLADACNELKLFAAAAEHYQAGLECPSGNMPLSAIERLCDLQILLAGEKSASHPERAIRDMESAISRLETLVALNPRRERCRLLGSARKRLAGMKQETARTGKRKTTARP